jgi:EmrB/QacA subfamily drug resistance transporter
VIAPAAAERAHPQVTLVVLSVAALAYSVLAGAINPALPTIQRALHASENHVTFVITGYLLAASVGTGIIGRLGDMFGKRRVLVWTLGILALGDLLAAVAHSLPLLITARVIQGTGGGIFPLSFAIIRDELPPERVPGSIGLISSILSLGSAAGIVIGGLVIEHLGWHALFWLPLAVTVLAALAAWRFIPESPIRTPGRINWTAAALMSTGISTVLLGISEATSWGWGSPKTLGLIAVGLFLCVLWVLVESRSAEPLIDMAMMRLRGVWTTNVVGFLVGAGMYSMFFVLPQFVQQPKSTGYGFGASVVVAGLYILPTTVGVVVVGATIGPITRRFGSKAAMLVGSALTALSALWIALQHGSPWDALITMGIFGLGIGLAFAATSNLIVEAVDPHQTGAAGGMNTVMRTIGGALGGQIAATFIAGHTLPDGRPALHGFVQAWELQVGILVVCVLAGFLVPRRRPFAPPLHEADAAPAPAEEGAR